ncbi:MAG: histone H1 [Beijerinckiaceae bacterium]|nr:MAG: histone H1 [Beijerinckiaceae bacterium]
MSKSPTRPRDPNQLAKLVIDIAIGEAKDSPKQASEDNPMASLGRIGGLKGGRARAEKLPAEKRVDIARQAAAARWRKDDG